MALRSLWPAGRVERIEMASLQELQQPIDRAIVDAMIESTPETWRSIVLTLERASSNSDIGAFRHELSSPEVHPPVGGAPSLFEATYRLDILLRTHGGVLRRAVYRATKKDDTWSWSADYEYDEDVP